LNKDILIDKKGRGGGDNNKKLIFAARGSEVKQKGWMEIYPAKIKEKDIPDLNGEVEITKIKTEQKQTQPPKRYSPASIVTELEKRNLGTKATRASILETLYNRGYIQDSRIKATPLGISLIDSLEKHSPIIIDEKLTREFEEDMQKVEESKESHLEKQEEKMDFTFYDTLTKKEGSEQERQKTEKAPAPRVQEKSTDKKETVKPPPPPATKDEEPKKAPVEKDLYFVQIASFTEKEKAEGLKNHLVQKGYKAQVAAVQLEGIGLRYRVRLGGYTSLQAALNAQTKISVEENITETMVVSEP